METFTLSIRGIVSLFAPSYTFASPIQASDPSTTKLDTVNSISITEGIDAYISDVSFDKSLSLLVFGSHKSDIKLHIIDKSGSSFLAAPLNARCSDKIEVDVSHLPKGNYKLLITQDELLFE